MIRVVLGGVLALAFGNTTVLHEREGVERGSCGFVDSL